MVTVLLWMPGCATEQVSTKPNPQASSAPVAESISVEQPTLVPKAMAALQEMSAYLRTLKTFKVNFKLLKDEILLSGQKVMIDGTMELTVQKPDSFHAPTKMEDSP